ncbi:MAG TPA: tRNA (cytidine(34)-2'-O)-methyltransferase, partial [Polyangiaceae bacterium]|nr:tRNA (cytidine(34)-2'-O)-methyltransferase [Polyangiaceae bacterium]
SARVGAIVSIDPDQRLRARGPSPRLNIVLVEPEIPPNTGNIARLCAATDSILHLVHPLGFDVSDKAVRRAGLDYWHLVQVTQHPSFDAFVSSLPKDARLHLFSGKATQSYLRVSYAPSDYLVFGRESSGLSSEVLERFADRLLGIPTLGKVRSLNLANAAALGIYEALRQLGALDDVALIDKSADPAAAD